MARRETSSNREASGRQASQRGRMLGIDEPDALRLAKMVEAGFAFGRVEKFQRASGLSLEDIARHARIAKRTLSRRQESGRLQPDESDRLLRLARVFELAADLFEGDAAGARQWLVSPQRGLGGRVPLDLAGTDVGCREVEALIARLEHGIFA